MYMGKGMAVGLGRVRVSPLPGLVNGYLGQAPPNMYSDKEVECLPLGFEGQGGED